MADGEDMTAEFARLDAENALMRAVRRMLRNDDDEFEDDDEEDEESGQPIDLDELLKGGEEGGEGGSNPLSHLISDTTREQLLKLQEQKRERQQEKQREREQMEEQQQLMIANEDSQTRDSIQSDAMDSMTLEQLACPEVALELNQLYQRAIEQKLVEIQDSLLENREKQAELKTLLTDQNFTSKSGRIGARRSRKKLAVYSKPYFKDANGMFPPPNEDTIMKANSGELDPFIKPPKLWLNSERAKLRECVRTDRLQSHLRPSMNRLEIKNSKLKAVKPGSEEEGELKESIADIKAEIDQIKNNTDVVFMYGSLDDFDKIDWMKISNMDFDGARTEAACKLFWKNAGHPLINSSKWTTEESDRLVQLVIKYEGVRWEEIAEELGTKRTAFMCLQHYQTKLNPCLHTGKWVADEDTLLTDIVTDCRQGDSIPWSTVAYYMEGRSREQCSKRWEQLNPCSFKRGRWTREEDEKLEEATKRFGTNSWWKVKDYVSGRSSAQCRERWTNTLDRSINFGSWTRVEDKKLWRVVKMLGEGKWQKIASSYLIGRTDNMCLQRYRRLQRWKVQETLYPNNKKVSSSLVPRLNSGTAIAAEAAATAVTSMTAIDTDTAGAAAEAKVRMAPRCRKLRAERERQAREDLRKLLTEAEQQVEAADMERALSAYELSWMRLNADNEPLEPQLQSGQQLPQLQLLKQMPKLQLLKQPQQLSSPQQLTAAQQRKRQQQQQQQQLQGSPQQQLTPQQLKLTQQQLQQLQGSPQQQLTPLQLKLNQQQLQQLQGPPQQQPQQQGSPQQLQQCSPVSGSPCSQTVRPLDMLPPLVSIVQEDVLKKRLRNRENIINDVEQRYRSIVTQVRARILAQLSGYSAPRISHTVRECLGTLPSDASLAQVIDIIEAIRLELGTRDDGSGKPGARTRTKMHTEEEIVEWRISRILRTRKRDRAKIRWNAREPGASTDEDDDDDDYRYNGDGDTGQSRVHSSTDPMDGKFFNMFTNALKYHTHVDTKDLEATGFQPTKFTPAIADILVTLFSRGPADTKNGSGGSQEGVEKEGGGGDLPDCKMDTTKGKAGCMRASLKGNDAMKMYIMPPLPPNATTLTGLRSMLLDRSRLMAIAGRFYTPKFLPRKHSRQISQGLGKNPPSRSTSETALAKAKANGSDRAKGKAKVTEEMKMEQGGSGDGNIDVPEGSGEVVRRGRGRPRGSVNKGLSTAVSRKFVLGAGRRGRPKKSDRVAQLRRQVIDLTSKPQACPQIIHTKEEGAVLSRILQSTHDFSMLHSRFNSLFLWPALLATVPVQDIAPLAVTSISAANQEQSLGEMGEVKDEETTEAKKRVKKGADKKERFGNKSSDEDNDADEDDDDECPKPIFRRRNRGPQSTLARAVRKQLAILRGLDNSDNESPVKRTGIRRRALCGGTSFRTGKKYKKRVPREPSVSAGVQRRSSRILKVERPDGSGKEVVLASKRRYAYADRSPYASDSEETTGGKAMGSGVKSGKYATKLSSGTKRASFDTSTVSGTVTPTSSVYSRSTALPEPALGSYHVETSQVVMETSQITMETSHVAVESAVRGEVAMSTDMAGIVDGEGVVVAKIESDGGLLDVCDEIWSGDLMPDLSSSQLDIEEMFEGHLNRQRSSTGQEQQLVSPGGQQLSSCDQLQQQLSIYDQQLSNASGQIQQQLSNNEQQSTAVGQVQQQVSNSNNPPQSTAIGQHLSTIIGEEELLAISQQQQQLLAIGQQQLLAIGQQQLSAVDQRSGLRSGVRASGQRSTRLSSQQQQPTGQTSERGGAEEEEEEEFIVQLEQEEEGFGSGLVTKDVVLPFSGQNFVIMSESSSQLTGQVCGVGTETGTGDMWPAQTTQPGTGDVWPAKTTQPGTGDLWPAQIIDSNSWGRDGESGLTITSCVGNATSFTIESALNQEPLMVSKVEEELVPTSAEVLLPASAEVLGNKVKLEKNLEQESEDALREGSSVLDDFVTMTSDESEMAGAAVESIVDGSQSQVITAVAAAEPVASRGRRGRAEPKNKSKSVPKSTRASNRPPSRKKTRVGRQEDFNADEEPLVEGEGSAVVKVDGTGRDDGVPLVREDGSGVGIPIAAVNTDVCGDHIVSDDGRKVKVEEQLWGIAAEQTAAPIITAAAVTSAAVETAVPQATATMKAIPAGSAAVIPAVSVEVASVGQRLSAAAGEAAAAGQLAMGQLAAVFEATPVAAAAMLPSSTAAVAPLAAGLDSSVILQQLMANAQQQVMSQLSQIMAAMFNPAAVAAALGNITLPQAVSNSAASAVINPAINSTPTTDAMMQMAMQQAIASGTVPLMAPVSVPASSVSVGSLYGSPIGVGQLPTGALHAGALQSGTLPTGLIASMLPSGSLPSGPPQPAVPPQSVAPSDLSNSPTDNSSLSTIQQQPMDWS